MSYERQFSYKERTFSVMHVLTDMGSREVGRRDSAHRAGRCLEWCRIHRGRGKGRCRAVVWAVQRQQSPQLMLVHALTRNSGRREGRGMVGMAGLGTNHERIRSMRTVRGMLALRARHVGCRRRVDD